MSKFNNRTLYRSISEAIITADLLLAKDSPMMAEIRNKHDWKWDTDNGLHVAETLMENDRWKCIPIFTYRPTNPFTKAIGYYRSGKIFINVKVIKNLDHCELVSLLLHEWAHYVGFTHGNNYKTKEKCLYSVPYWVSENVKRWVK